MIQEKKISQLVLVTLNALFFICDENGKEATVELFNKLIKSGNLIIYFLIEIQTLIEDGTDFTLKLSECIKRLGNLNDEWITRVLIFSRIMDHYEIFSQYKTPIYISIEETFVMDYCKELDWSFKVISKNGAKRISSDHMNFLTTIEGVTKLLESMVQGQCKKITCTNTSNFDIPSHSSSKFISYFQHGSEDSLDVDIAYWFPSTVLPSNKDCLSFIENQLISGDKSRDINMFCVGETGVVTDCFKGLVDELNNALLTTVPLHKQVYDNFEFPIKKKVKRNVPMKVATTILNIFVKIRRVPSVRQKVVEALQNRDFQLRKHILKCLDLKIIAEEKDIDLLDISKYIAFRLGQTIALINGIELYTKKDIASVFPDLKPMIYRETNQSNANTHFSILDKTKNRMIDMLKYVKVTKRGSIHMFSLEKSKLVTEFEGNKQVLGEESKMKEAHLGCQLLREEMNHYEAQSNGMLIDMNDIRLVFYPTECNSSMLGCKLPQHCQWPSEGPPQKDLTKHEHLIFIFDTPYSQKSISEIKKSGNKKKEFVTIALPQEKNKTFNIVDGEDINDPKKLTPRVKKQVERSTQLQRIISQLDFKNYFHTFTWNTKDETLQLYASRSRFAHQEVRWYPTCSDKLTQ